MLNKGAEVNAIDKSCFTALITASIWGTTEVVRSLLASGADTNFRKIYLNPWNSYEIDEYDKIYNLKKDTNKESGWTALMFAAKNGYVEIAKDLLEAGLK